MMRLRMVVGLVLVLGVASAQADITSRVLALALHAGGVFSLHASAVSIDGAGVAFLAPKHYGKSTLCSALVLAGARALSDDTVPVRPGNPPSLSPGIHSSLGVTRRPTVASLVTR